MLMKHLQGGVKKGAFSQEEAQKRFDAWKAEKSKKLSDIANGVREAKKATAKELLEAEVKKNEAKAEAVAKKKAEIAAAKAAAEAEALKAAQEAAEAAKAAEAEEAAPAEEAPAAE